MALNNIQKVRLEVGDTEVDLPILSDEEYEYFLEKNSNSVRRASIDAAKSILFKMSMRSDETVDIFSIKGSKAAQSYVMALNMFLKNPDLNPILQSAMPYGSGISISDMQANIQDSDNNSIQQPTDDWRTFPTTFFER